VEILWDALIDGFSAARYVCKVSRTAGFAHANPPDRIRPAQAVGDSVFDNQVERASRERADSGISPKRSHKKSPLPAFEPGGGKPASGFRLSGFWFC